MKAIILLLTFFLFLPAEWQMFSDMEDTYIYNTGTGEVFIRTRRGGKNYKDVFVRMPRGVLPEEMKVIEENEETLPLLPSSTQSAESSNEQQEKLQDEARKLQQKIMESVIQ